MSACTEAGCDGTIAPDGYCDTCGMAAGSGGGMAASAGAPPAAAAAPAPPVAGAACTEAGCDGTIAADGYCDTCGMAASASPGPAGSAPAHVHISGGGEPPSIAAPAPPSTSRRVGSSRRTASARTGSTRTRLGAGLVDIAPTEVGDPAGAVMSAEKIAGVIGEVPEEDRQCTSCGQPVGRSVDGRPGRVTGFCSNCRTPFDFQTNAPTLQAGELVAGQYEILGPIAHGGMGWIYLGRDKAVSDRWVVLKGLLNESDPDAAAAAVAERQYLAQIEHPNIVNIYNFVTHLGRGYIVMEYVGGDSLNSKLKDRRKANGGRPDPLPVEQAIAYIIGVLPAFGYLHGLGLVYNDLKPANVMAVGGDVKLIDVGAVMRITDDQAAIFGTQGFQAPEVASMGPSISSDLYTVGRTLAVLMLEFVFHAGEYQYSIPPPRAFGQLAQWESLHRFLLKATAEHPDDRFQDAGVMGDQLTGILREVTTVTSGAPRPAPSRWFGGDRLTTLLVADADMSVVEADWRVLPTLKVDPADPASAFIEDIAELDGGQRIGLIDTAIADGQVRPSRELTFARAAALIEAGTDPSGVLQPIADEDPWEWRVEWYRSLWYLASGEAAAAAEGFSRVWTEVPGELAPRVGAAMAAESAGEFTRAAQLYERVIAIDSTWVSAAFGLARCRAAAGDRPGAVDAYRRVPASSATYQDAQMASARALIDGPDVDVEQLAEAASVIERLQLDAAERAAVSTEILERALATGSGAGSVRLFGHGLDDVGLRRGLEELYREQARLAADSGDKVRLIDKANAVRPRSLV